MFFGFPACLLNDVKIQHCHCNFRKLLDEGTHNIKKQSLMEYLKLLWGLKTQFL